MAPQVCDRLRLFQRLLTACHPTVPATVRAPAVQEVASMLDAGDGPTLLHQGADDVLRAGSHEVLAAARPHLPAVAALRDAEGPDLDEDGMIRPSGPLFSWHGPTANVDAAALLMATRNPPIASLWEALEVVSRAVDHERNLPLATVMMAVSLSVFGGLDRTPPATVSSRLRTLLAWRLSGSIPASVARHLAPLDDALALLPADAWVDVWGRERRVLALPVLQRFAGTQATAEAIRGGRFSHAKRHRLDVEVPTSLHKVFPVVALMPDLAAYESLDIDGRADALYEAMASLRPPEEDGVPPKRRRSPDDAFTPEAEAKRAERARKRLDAEAARLLDSLDRLGNLGL